MSATLPKLFTENENTPFKRFMLLLVHQILSYKVVFILSHLLAMVSFVGMWIAAIQKMFFDNGELFISFEYFLASVGATTVAVWMAAKTWDKQIAKTENHKKSLKTLEDKLDRLTELYNRNSQK